MQISPSAFAAAAVAAILALLAFAIPAKAEIAEGVSAAPEPAVESPVSTAPVTQEATSTTESTGAAVEGAPSTTPPAPTSTEAAPALSDAAPVTTSSDPVPAPPVDVGPAVGEEPDTTADPMREVSKLTGRIGQDSPQAVSRAASDTVAAPVHEASKLAGGIGRDSAETISPVVPFAERTTTQVAAPVNLRTSAWELGALNFDIPTIVEDSLPAHETPAKTPSFINSPSSPTHSLPQRPASHLGTDLLGRYRYPPELDATSSRWQGAGAEARNPERSLPKRAVAPSIADVASAAPGGGGATESFDDPTPLDGPLPLPGPSGAAAPGPGGSFFSPIVALLALLALAAPAVHRRLWEVPDFRAPTPFVCALERPG